MSDATIIREVVQPLTRSAQDYDSLLALIGDARFVLLGEASHGTHEFYAQRAAITKRLIAERGFTVVSSSFGQNIDGNDPWPAIWLVARAGRTDRFFS